MLVGSHAKCCGRLILHRSSQERLAFQPASPLYGSNHCLSRRASSAGGLGFNVTRSAACLTRRGSKLDAPHSIEDLGQNYSSSSASAASPDASDTRYATWQLEKMALCHCWRVHVMPILCRPCVFDDSSKSLLCRYSVSDEQGSRMEGSCLHNMHLAAGDVHLWWLFPEDVGPFIPYCFNLLPSLCIALHPGALRMHAAIRASTSDGEAQAHGVYQDQLPPGKHDPNPCGLCVGGGRRAAEKLRGPADG